MKLKVNVSQKRIEAAIAEGIVLNKTIYLDVDLDSLSKEEREVLSRNVEYNVNDNLFIAKTINKYSDSKDYYQFNSEKLEDIIEEMKIKEKVHNEYLEEFKKSILKEVEEFLSGKSNRIFRTGYYEDNSGSFDFKRLENEISEHNSKYGLNIDSDLILKRAKEVEQEIEKIKAENVAKKQAEAAAEAAVKEAGKQALKEWALQNGSELLKARIEENMNWYELANKEYFESIIPEGFSRHSNDDYDSCWPYNNPTLEHIKELREARKNKVFTSVELRKCREEDDYGNDVFHYFVVGKIPSFDGSYTIEASKEIDTSNY